MSGICNTKSLLYDVLVSPNTVECCIESEKQKGCVGTHLKHIEPQECVKHYTRISGCGMDARAVNTVIGDLF